jgi:hypothetical protein
VKIWPLSVLRGSPLMPPAFAWELQRFYAHLPSENAFNACIAVARQTQAVETERLAITETVNGAMGFVFTGYPSAEEWAHLERAAVVEGDDGYLCLVMDRLH